MKLFLLLLIPSLAFAQSKIGTGKLGAGFGGAPVAAGGGAFTYYSASFDGSTIAASYASDLTGIADGAQGTISFWFRVLDNFNKEFIIETEGGIYFSVDRNASDEFEVTGYDPSSTQLLGLTSNTAGGINNDGLWHHIIISFDLSQANKSWIYLDGSDVTGSRTHVNGSIDFTRGGWHIAEKYDGTTRWNGLLCEVWFSTTYFDLTSPSNVQKFRTSGGKPADLGSDGSTPTGGTKPLVYFHSQVPNWHVNVGSGGGFTQVGTIVDGGSNKP